MGKIVKSVGGLVKKAAPVVSGVSGIVGGISNIAGALSGTTPSSTAGLQSAATNQTELMRDMYNQSVQRGEPFYQTGVAGVNKLRDLAGLGENQDAGFVQQQLESDPSYQFRLSQGQQALDRAMAAQGKTLDPEYAKKLAEYNQGYASQEYGNLFNRLAGISGMGQAQQAQGAALGRQYGQDVGAVNLSLAEAQYAADAANRAKGSNFFGNILGTAAGRYF